MWITYNYNNSCVLVLKPMRGDSSMKRRRLCKSSSNTRFSTKHLFESFFVIKTVLVLHHTILIRRLRKQWEEPKIKSFVSKPFKFTSYLLKETTNLFRGQTPML
uniref:Uncharacterized protein n=1 Tax=Cacopsylla melanoneura TaxID=428564 RepID=A0A8D8RIE4_9HEMI